MIQAVFLSAKISITTNSNPQTPFPVRFYDSTDGCRDSRGRTLSTILSWPDSRLEFCHAYIQNLFPLPESSPFNPSAPIIDKVTFTTFRSSPELRNRLSNSLRKMTLFYGFSWGNENGKVDIAPNNHDTVFKKASKNWLMPFNHNHLRITRIIRSCRVLGLEDDAQAFYAAFLNVAKQRPGVISQRSLMYWQRAAERPLYLAPEDDEDLGQGKDFLCRFEEERKRAGLKDSDDEAEI
ncbi:MAG: hypothetical protein Q9201_003866 [Fulgogasparrea decipioides]